LKREEIGCVVTETSVALPLLHVSRWPPPLPFGFGLPTSSKVPIFPSLIIGSLVTSLRCAVALYEAVSEHTGWSYRTLLIDSLFATAKKILPHTHAINFFKCLLAHSHNEYARVCLSVDHAAACHATNMA